MPAEREPRILVGGMNQRERALAVADQFFQGLRIIVQLLQ